MKATFPLGRWAGIPIGAHWSVLFTVLFVVSLLAHELAHAVLARRFGVRVKSITLWMLGGAAMFDDEPPTRADGLAQDRYSTRVGAFNRPGIRVRDWHVQYGRMAQRHR